MARLIIEEASAAEAGFKQLSQEAARRIVAMPADQCPVEFTQSLTRLFLSESCGKCTPCRIGLAQLVQLQQEVLDGVAPPKRSSSSPARRRESWTAPIARSATKQLAWYSKACVPSKGIIARMQERDLCSAERNTYVPCQGTCPAHIDIPGYSRW